MADPPCSQATRLLLELQGGDPSAADRLMPLVYAEVREIAGRVMRHERGDHTLQPTALVHEAYVRLVDQERVAWQGRSHFYAVAAQAMRRILVDHARHAKREKRGGDRARVTLSAAEGVTPDVPTDVSDLDVALEKLAGLDPRQARIVELRFFAGLGVQEVADSLGISKRTAESDWTMARAWLARELTRADGRGGR